MFSLFERISPAKIVLKHFETLYNAKTAKINWICEVIPLLLFAIAVSFYLPFKLEVIIDSKISPYILGGFSVAGGFLINSLMVLAEKQSDKTEIKAADQNNKLLKETFYNTSFGVLICLLATLVCIVYPISKNVLWMSVLSGFIYFLTIFFFHTVLMVIKRLSKIFDPD
jgi:hypothetical protein